MGSSSSHGQYHVGTVPDFLHFEEDLGTMILMDLGEEIEVETMRGQREDIHDTEHALEEARRSRSSSTVLSAQRGLVSVTSPFSPSESVAPERLRNASKILRTTAAISAFQNFCASSNIREEHLEPIRPEEFNSVPVGKPQDFFQSRYNGERPFPFILYLDFNEDVQSPFGVTLRAQTESDLSHCDVWGKNQTIAVVDCLSQSERLWSGLKTFKSFQASFRKGTKRPKAMISNEISHLSLAKDIQPATFVRYYDWATRLNVTFSKDSLPGSLRYYGLTDEGALTPFHADYSATTSLLWVLEGEKIIYLLEPTTERLERVLISEAFPTLSDDCDAVFKVHLYTGDAILLPGGWIHAVETISPSAMLMSNFLHDYNITLQIQMWKMEQELRSDTSHFHPEFVWLNWCASLDLLRRIEQEAYLPDEIPPQTERMQVIASSEILKAMLEANPDLPRDPPLPSLDSLMTLADFLMEESCDILEESQRRLTDFYEEGDAVTRIEITEIAQRIHKAVGLMKQKGIRS